MEECIKINLKFIADTYRDRTKAPEHVAELTAHLNTCNDCNVAWRTFDLASTELGGIPPLEVFLNWPKFPTGFTAQLREAFASKASSSPEL